MVEHVLPVSPLLTPNLALAELPQAARRKFINNCKSSLVQLFSPYVSTWEELCKDLHVQGGATIDPDDPNGPVIEALRARFDHYREQMPEELHETQLSTSTDGASGYKGVPWPPWVVCEHVENSTLSMVYDEEQGTVSFSNSPIAGPAVQLKFTVQCSAC